MSHFFMGVIVPKNLKGDDIIKNYVIAQMENFNEDNEVDPYIKYSADKKEEYLKDKIAKYERMCLPKYAEQYIQGYCKEQFELYSAMPAEKFWEELIEYETPDKDGNVVWTCNPNSKWDWWCVGGRYDGSIKGIEVESTDKGFNFDNKHELLENNKTTIGEFLALVEKEKQGCYGILDTNGVWTDRHDGDWDSEEDWQNKFVEILKQCNLEDSLVGVDCHI
jgi:hypothetical protein